MTVSTTPWNMTGKAICQISRTLMTKVTVFMGLQSLPIGQARYYRTTLFTAFVVSCGRAQAAVWLANTTEKPWLARYSAAVDRVVSNGCDVVRVAHRQYKQREWMGSHQHRISFSRAEIALINSWVPVQQIVYHMLWVFMKTERLTETVTTTPAQVYWATITLKLWCCGSVKGNRETDGPMIWVSLEFVSSC